MNNNHLQKGDVRDTVLERIRSGNVRMRSRIFFIAKTILVCVVVILVSLLSILIASFIFFALRVGGHESLLGFGPRGIIPFLALFPWPLLLLDVVLLAFLEMLLREFRFAYRRSLLYLFLGLVAVVGGLGLLIDAQTKFNHDRFMDAQEGRLPPPLRGAYTGARGMPPERLGVYRGFVTQVDQATFSMTHNDQDQDLDDRRFTVVPPPGFPLSQISPGDHIYVAGDHAGGVIHAYGIRVLTDQ